MITALMDAGRMPNRSQEQKQFDDFVAEYMRNLPVRGQQENDLAAMINMTAAGGAYALGYVFDSATGDSDPGAGRLRLSSAVQNASTFMRLDTLSSGQDVTSLIDGFDASTSTVKGTIRLVKMGDLTKWMTFDVKARFAPNGYRNLAVVATGGSAASPFVNGDGIMLFFQRNGDAGAISSAMTPILTYTISSPIAQIDFLNIFNATSADYDRVIIDVLGLEVSSREIPSIQLGNVNGLDAAALYYGGYSAGYSNPQTKWQCSFPLNTGGFSIELLNLNSTSTTGGRVRQLRSFCHYADSASTPGYGSQLLMGLAYPTASAGRTTGFRLAIPTTFVAGKINIFGVKN